MSSPVWFITASSSGFGKYIALEALKRKHRVIATARNAAKIDDLKAAGAHTISLDVTDSLDNIKVIVDEAQTVYGRIDILINAAGYILEGAAEEATPEETTQLFNTNVFGALNVIRAVLPHMRAQKSGVVTLFGSLGSWRAGPAYALYSATKWACSAIAEGLYEELEPFGISATVIEPGYFRTGFLNPGARILTEKRLKDYDDTVVGKIREALNNTDNNQPGDVSKGASVIVDILTSSGAAEGKKIPIRIALGTDCDSVIRNKCSSTIALLDEWKDVFLSTDYPKGE